MSDLGKNGKVILTKEQVKKAFEEQGAPVPNDFKAKKPTKLERKLTHIGIEHLFMGALQHLKLSKDELKDLADKSDNAFVTNVLSDVVALEAYVKKAINKLAAKIESHPGVDELNEIFEKLQEELKAAMELHLNNQKGESDEGNSSDVPE